jgi:hypothetical protein
MMASGAIAGPVLFTLAWLVLGFISPGYELWGTRVAPYSAISSSISGLGLGPTGPYMNAAFIVSGLLMFLGVIGISQWLRPVMSPTAYRWSVIFLALPAIGSIIDGIFTFEDMLPHLLGFGCALISLVGFPVVGVALRHAPYWRRFGRWLIVAGPLTLLLAIVYFANFQPTVAGQETGFAGLAERILVVEILWWYVLLGWLALRQKRS